MSKRSDTKNVYLTQGIVLSDRNYRETSKIVNIMTKNLGKINVFVYGALKPNSRLLMSTKMMTKSNFRLNLSKNSYYINSAQIIDSNLDLAKDIRTYLTAQFICEIVDRTMVENFKDQRIYNLIDTAFLRLKEGMYFQYIKLGFLIKYLSFIGFKPNLDGCSICEDVQNLVFSNKFGGLICPKHLDIDDEYSDLNKSELMEIKKLLYTRFSDYKNFENLDKIDKIIMDFFKYNTEITDLRSERIFQTLKSKRGGK